MKKLTAIICSVFIILSSLMVSVGINPLAYSVGTDILTAEELAEKLKGTGAYTESDGVLTSVEGKDSKSAMLTNEQNFELKFTVGIPSDVSGDLQIRIRSKDVTGHSVGYRVYISNSRISLQKFNDTNWQSTELKSAANDFTNKTEVAIIADGAKLTITLDGQNKIETQIAIATCNSSQKSNDL